MGQSPARKLNGKESYGKVANKILEGVFIWQPNRQIEFAFLARGRSTTCSPLCAPPSPGVCTRPTSPAGEVFTVRGCLSRGGTWQNLTWLREYVFEWATAAPLGRASQEPKRIRLLELEIGTWGAWRAWPTNKTAPRAKARRKLNIHICESSR